MDWLNPLAEKSSRQPVGLATKSSTIQVIYPVSQLLKNLFVFFHGGR
jgi:hypothetical protein